MDAEAMELVSSSAQQVAQRLQFFRVAFGLAAGAVRTGGDVMKLLTPAVVGRKSTIDWPGLEPGAMLPVPDNGAKLLLNLAMLAGEALPRGGAIELAINVNDDAAEIAISSSGAGAKLDPEIVQALAGEIPIENLTPRSAQAYYAGRLAESLGGEVEVKSGGPDSVLLRASPIRIEAAAYA
jgi:histidine phosphotransferase ChpT